MIVIHGSGNLRSQRPNPWVGDDTCGVRFVQTVPLGRAARSISFNLHALYDGQDWFSRNAVSRHLELKKRHLSIIRNVFAAVEPPALQEGFEGIIEVSHVAGAS